LTQHNAYATLTARNLMKTQVLTLVESRNIREPLRNDRLAGLINRSRTTNLL